MRRRLWALLLLVPLLCGSSWEVTGSFDLSGSWESGSVGAAFVTVAASGLSSATQDQLPYATEEDGAGDLSSRIASFSVDVTSVSELNAAGFDGTNCALTDYATSSTADNAADLECLLEDTDAATYCLEFPAGETFNFNTPTDGLSMWRPSSTYPNRCIVSSTPGTKATLRSGAVHCLDAGADGTCDEGTLAGAPATAAQGMNLFEGEDPTYGSDLGWTDGGSRGDDTLTFTSVTGLADGDWLLLEASPAGMQPDGNVQYRVKVTGAPSTGAEGVTIDRPLPDDFDSGGTLTAREWTNPNPGWYVQDIEFTFQYPEHQGEQDTLFDTRTMVESTFKNVTFDGYQYALLVQHSARLRFETIDVSGNFDKPFNNYGITVSNSSDITFIDATADTPESFACAGNSQNILVAFSYFPPPPANANYDDTCSGSLCDWTYIVAHDTAHGPVEMDSTSACTDTSPPDGECDSRTGETPAADALYTHCSRNEGDRLGVGGSAACKGTPSDWAEGSMTLHNASCSNLLIVRSHLTAGLWRDYFDGPGRYNTVFGSLFNEHSSGTFTAGGLDDGGDIGSKSLSNPGDVREDYAINESLIGNSIRYIGGGPSNSLDRMMEGSRIEYNAIREGCEHSSNESAIVSDCGSATNPGWAQGSHTGSDSTTVLTDATYMVDPNVRDLVGALLWNQTDGESCTITGHTSTTLTCSGGLSGAGEWNSGDDWAVGGNNVSWTGNDVLTTPTDTPSIGITLPSAPGFDAFPTLSGSGTAPYVGADQGGVSAKGDSQNCLPAYERYHGSC